MSEIYYALIIFPIFFMIAMGFIYASALADIQVQQLKLNCPYPINSGVATNVTISSTMVVDYILTPDTSPDDYHVTVFHCQDANAGGLGPPTPQVTTTIYTTANNWFLVAGQAGGFLFVIAESMTEFFLKVIALGTLVQLFLNSPALVLAIPEYVYVNIVLVSFVALGGFMVVRG